MPRLATPKHDDKRIPSANFTVRKDLLAAVKIVSTASYEQYEHLDPLRMNFGKKLDTLSYHQENFEYLNTLVKVATIVAHT